MLIMLDTNALFADPLMLRSPARDILSLLDAANARLVYSPVVLAEIRRQHDGELRQPALEIKTRLNRIGRRAAISVTDLITQVDSVFDEAKRRWSQRIDEILAHPRVRRGEWPEIDARNMVDRELAQRRPFVDKEPGTVGHRDTVIWLGLLCLAAQHPEEQVVLVTADAGFLSRNQLHPDLVEDLTEAGIDVGRVRHLNSLAALVELLKDEASAQTNKLRWRNTRVTELIHGLLQGLDASQFAPTWNVKDGGPEAPEFDIGLSWAVTDWYLAGVDGPADLEIPEVPAGTDSLRCTFTADLSFSGLMDKSDWFADPHPGLELWDSDWNEHYVSIEASRTLKFVATLWLDDENEDVDLESIDQVSIVSDHIH